jgi:hypothetical protein
MNEEQKHTARVSAEAVSAIDFLTKRPEFQRFLGKLREREAQYAAAILNDDMADGEREKLRQRRLELVEIIQWPEQERAAHVSILGSFGIRPGDGLEVGL